ncbi:tRNA uridine-5-carboxymethylaminomethyl(34) synthesis GTPase MnmE [Lutimaribacter sp. EGI FJ00015]|uniref:tRNA uridine-5-carboxymethylaminomethyl(34) synthesis GTPase MnmE n=1 Tax=Lutimaribacter degradans TaxID=2945989 RepID=A0ACC5ZX68_9RHOB|nr:tRNA uridine-5-carboxymethylaminomethyl(34) synthesis GTPase MnmE [Lutimaribacter sp. EGI FJ00013]MCM2561974.1 tRNA uridine-5-carboxymethylaminomethyl(34) synthesis GTPase MnmE [Lutimaribacter sp. EGI FJ00013]MCO0612994.1 tRNA uridine-5-carboxymethylaminomethyl(34) synthesis GTPase MnmE [Lutimaribacter sp. EGI FJ00015]MCO0635806.1 tRNA uridine-5-carboxymethylaminomethyl(34) synthesis GTPase MnmE [Lutimaribacter sp. EGI FJ00014]
MDTIFALATAPGKAGVAVVRVSGPSAFVACVHIAGSVPKPRHASLRRLSDLDGDTLDEALVLVFQAGHSFTGEDVVEFQCHGSVAITSAILRALGELPGLRMAEPGEFTRRALENGRLDLTQVEGLADLIESETEMQRKQAQRLLEGAIGEKAETWRRDLIRAAALLEAVIDFADEDVPEDVSDEVLALTEKSRLGISQELRGIDAAERVRTGFEVAIVGAPNVGKSTLLNALAGRDAAITSEYAGTTRDVIEVRMDLGGLPVTVLDTAGLRETEDHVEGIGIARARERAQAADLRIFLTDGEAPDLAPAPGDIVIQAKADLRGSGVSGKTGQGVEQLVSEITDRLQDQAAHAGLASRERHRLALAQAISGLQAAETHVRIGAEQYDLGAEELRNVVRALESLVGRIDVENLLDEIFASFCLGK